MNYDTYPYIARTQINGAEIKARHKGEKHLPDRCYNDVRRGYKVEKMP